jgi:glycosyltransferase involved in cell wall biosynthesis
MTAAVPAVSVITATWQRHDLLLERCIPSVQAQGHPAVEHVVVSDGPDGVLSKRLAQPWLDGWKDLLYREVGQHDEQEHYGHHVGLEYASGEYITYCDDDDSIRPDHCHRLAAALDADPDAGFAVSRMVSHHAHPVTVGWGPLAPGNVGSPMIMHRRQVLEHGTWGPASWKEDWELVERWLDAGVKYVNVNAETSDVWPSRFRVPQ